MDPSPTSSAEKTQGGTQSLPRAYLVRSERERLLEAMLRVAAAKGYEATTVRDVIEGAGVSEQTFEQPFGDKESCFLEAYEAVFDVLLAHMTSAFEAAAGRPWPEGFSAAVGALVRRVATRGALFGLPSIGAGIARLSMVEVTAAGDDARARYRSALARFTPFLEEGREYAAGGEELPADTARFAIGGATSMIFDEIRAGRGPELRRILPDLVFAVLMPYLGPEAAEDEMRRVTRGR